VSSFNLTQLQWISQPYTNGKMWSWSSECSI
jgi:hypothetical protein